MISGCSLDKQHGVTVWHPANVGFSSSRYTNNSSFRCSNDEQIDHLRRGQQRRKWTSEDNKLALYCYFRSNPAKRGYRKRLVVTQTPVENHQLTLTWKTMSWKTRYTNSCPGWTQMKLKEHEKKDKYHDLARELKKTVEHESDVYNNCY